MCFALLLLLYHPLSQPVWIRLSVRYFAYVCVGFEMHTVSRLHTAAVVDLRISLLLARLATTIPDIYDYYYNNSSTNCTACGHHSESFRKSASGGNTAALLCFFVVFCCAGGGVSIDRMYWVLLGGAQRKNPTWRSLKLCHKQIRVCMSGDIYKSREQTKERRCRGCVGRSVTASQNLPGGTYTSSSIYLVTVKDACQDKV